MFFGWVCIAFILQHFQSVDQARAGFARLDDIIHVTTLGCNERIGEFFAIFCHQFGFPRNRICGFLQFLAEHYADSSFRTHDRDFCGRPGQVYITANMLG